MPLDRFRCATAGALALAAAVLAACGGGGGDAQPPAPPRTAYTVASGVAQKGPLVRGSAVTLQDLGVNLAGTGAQHAATVDSDLGTFTPGATFASRYVGVTATGAYLDEVLGQTSDGSITLQAYADAAVDTTLNVNLLTTLASKRIAALVNGSGLSFEDARVQAETEVLAAFNIATKPAVARFGALDLADAGAGGAATDGDRILAALSAVFVQGRGAAEVAALVASVRDEIAAQGTIIDATLKAQISTSSMAVDLDRAAANLSAAYAAMGSPISPAGLAEWLDRDGDGVIGHDEFVADPGASSFTLPAGFSAAHAGQTVKASPGATLLVNGAAVADTAQLRAGDTVTLAESASPAPGLFAPYLLTGAAPVARIARVAFVNGLVSVAVTPGAASLALGLNQRFTATGTFKDGRTQDLARAVRWSSSVPAVADIDAGTGQADALSPGDTTLTASVAGVTGSTGLAVTTASIQSITLAPTSLQTGVGITRTLVATGTFSDGHVADVTANLAWQTQAPGTATVAGGEVTGVALGSTRVSARAGAVSASATVDVTTDRWTAAPDMPTARVAGAVATPLADGTVLVTGGANATASGIAAADRYDPIARAWRAAGTVASMSTARTSHTATRLADGRVLVAGGSTPGAKAAEGYANLALAEIYDPVANTWTPAASLHVARAHHTATLLADGRVLVTGGENDRYLPEASAELYDPSTDSWTTSAAALTASRSTHTATRLADGRVLIAGGFDIVGGTLTPQASAELYDPRSGSFTATTGPMTAAHAGHTASLLGDGSVLVAGGGGTQAERYDPATGAWRALPAMGASRSGAVALALPSGVVLIAGGTTAAPNAERFAPTTGRWTNAASLSADRVAPVAAGLPDGSALVCGGAAEAAGASCEFYW